MIRIWGSKNGTWLQVLNASYYVGCLISPLLAKPFLVGNENDVASDCYGYRQSSIQHSNNDDSVQHGYDTTPDNRPDTTDIFEVYDREELEKATFTSTNFVTVSGYTGVTSIASFSDTSKSPETHIWKVFLLAGAILFVAAVGGILLYIFGSHSKDPCEDSEESRNKTESKTKESLLVRLLIAQMTGFVFITCCLQRGVNSYLFAFAVQCRSWQKSQATYLKTVYQSGVLTGRLLSVFLLLHVSPQMLLLACCLVSVATFSALTFSTNYAVIIWLSAGIAGLSLGPIYGCMLSWAHQHFTVGGKVGALFQFSVSTSDILGSLVINLLYDRYGLSTYIYLSLILTILMTVFVAFMFLTVKCMKSRRTTYSPANACELETTDDDAKLWSLVCNIVTIFCRLHRWHNAKET